MLDPKQIERDRERKKRQKRARFSGYVRSRKFKRKMKKALASDKVLNPASIDALDDGTVPRAGLPYKKYRNEILEIMSQNAILEHRTRVNPRTAQPFNYSIDTAQSIKKTSKSPSTIKKEPVAIKCEKVENVSKSKEKSKPSECHSQATNKQEKNSGKADNVQPRRRRRINYSEELVDEAFMYEQILHDKQKQQEKSKKANKVDMAGNGKVLPSASSSGNLSSSLRLLEQNAEISITPLKSRLVANDKKTLGASIPVKSEASFNITSSVSVHIKQRKSDPMESNLRISNITSLHTSNPDISMTTKKRKISCQYCQQTFLNQKLLAEHQVVHLRISLYKLNSTKILHPRLRRVSTNKQFW